MDAALREEAYNHGMALNPRNDRVQCNYCGMVVSGFDCLQIHLGGKGKSPECQNVPSNVKEMFQNRLNLVKEKNQKTGSFYKADCPVDSIVNSKGDNRKRGKAKSFQSDEPKDSKRVNSDFTVNRFHSLASASNLHHESIVQNIVTSGEGNQSSSVVIKRWIGRFLIANAIDFDAAKSYSFRKMIEVVSNVSDITCHIPGIQELKGWILSDELRETKKYVHAIRDSWSRTGCSIVLDGWVDDRGQNILIFLVDCPLGAVYIDSFDTSTVMEDVEGFLILLEGVLEEVGIQNVVQIISHSSSNFMNDVGQRLIEKHRSLFWSVSASHCVTLMLEKIGMIKSVNQVLDKAKTITRFIYCHADVLKLVRSHIRGIDLIKPSKIKAAVPFLTLENILIEKENLKNLISSSEWMHSSWASNVIGKKVADLLHDQSFWDRISVVVRATIPLVNVLSLINKDAEPYVGFIYETMDQVKEIISEELELEETQYMPYWKIIDDVWDSLLHIPLHAAGYFLNPRFLYTEDFCADSEVAGGLLATIVRMVEDPRTQDLITKQLEVYRGCQGAFKTGTENEKQNSIPPVAWWSSFGSHCPELQKLAIRILSQSCNGAESYTLKKNVAEKLLCNSGRNHAEQQLISNMAYIHYNMNLKQKKWGARCDGEAGEIDSYSDWIMDEEDLSKDALGKRGNVSGVGRNVGVHEGPSDKPKVEL